jgi:D-mannonate dehydratase
VDIFVMGNKKIIRATGSKKQEAYIARYMRKVRAMQAAGVTPVWCLPWLTLRALPDWCGE